MADFKSFSQVIRTKLNHPFRILLSLLTILIMAILVLAFSNVGISFMWAMFALIALVVFCILAAFGYGLLKDQSLLRGDDHIVEMQKLGSRNPVHNPETINVNARAIQDQLGVGTPSLPSPKE